MLRGKATIDYDGRDLLVQFAPWRRDIVDEIKAAIPQGDREWDVEDKAWRVTPLYLDQICEVFEVFEYAIRDYSGDDREAKIRQAGHIARRVARDEREAAAQAKADERQRQRDETRRKTEPKRKKASFGGFYFDDEPEPDNAYDDMPGDEPNPPFNDWEEKKASWFDDLDRAEQEHLKKQRELFKEWREKFFLANPWAKERHYRMWWMYFSGSGLNKDEANRLFAERVMQEKQWRSGSAYDWRAGYQQRNGNGNAKTAVKGIDHYAILGIVRGADFEEARAAYRTKALEHHPDRGGSNEMMAKVNHAWDEIREENHWT